MGNAKKVTTAKKGKEERKIALNCIIQEKCHYYLMNMLLNSTL